MRTALVLALGFAAACGGSDAVWSSSVSRLVLRSSGGFGPPSQPTAECPAAGAEYTLVVADRSLSAWRCQPGPTAPHPLMRSSLSQTLSATDYDALLPELQALRVISVDTCGADKPEVTVIVTTPSGTTEYADSFYACNHLDQPTIDSTTLDAVAHTFSLLAFPVSSEVRDWAPQPLAP
jgi:hypothetical protein